MKEFNRQGIAVEVKYSTLTEEMRRLQMAHQDDCDNMFALGALMALSWVRDGTRMPTDILRKSDLQS